MEQHEQVHDTYLMEKRKRWVLVVEDFQPIRDMLAVWFTRLGYEVIVAENGLEALDFFINNHFDLVITDLSMPVMDGKSLALQVKERAPDTRVVIMTGEDRSHVSAEIEGEFVDAILFKPFDLRELKEITDDLFT